MHKIQQEYLDLLTRCLKEVREKDDGDLDQYFTSYGTAFLRTNSVYDIGLYLLLACCLEIVVCELATVSYSYSQILSLAAFLSL